MRVTIKGQVTIPQEVREKLGIFPGTEVEFIVEKNSAKIQKAKPGKGKPSRGDRVVERLRGKSTVKMTTEEIMKLTRGWGEDDLDR